MEPLADGGPRRRPLWPGFGENDDPFAPSGPEDEEQDRKALFEELRKVPLEERPRPYNRPDPFKVNASIHWLMACCVWRWPVRSLLVLMALMTPAFVIAPDPGPVLFVGWVVIAPAFFWAYPLYVMRRWIAAGVPAEPPRKRWWPF